MYFTDEIIKPNLNLTVVNDSFIDVTIIPGAFNNPAYLNFTWNMTYLSAYYFELQLHFKDPYYVSYEVRYLNGIFKELRHAANCICLEWIVHLSVNSLAHQVTVHDSKIHT